MNEAPTSPTGGSEDETTLLIRRLHETEERLRELTAGEVDAVVHPGGHSYLLYQAQEKLLQSEATQRRLATTQLAILNALPAHIALLDKEGVIVAVNESWRRFASANVLQGSDYGVGLNYLEVCDSSQGDCSAEAHAAALGIRSVLRGDLRHFALEYPCHSPTEQRWFRVMVTPLHEGRPGGVVVMHVNITDRKLAEESLRESEERFRGTFEQAAVGIAHVGADGRFLRVNDRLCRILGFTWEELLRLNFDDITTAEDRATSREARRAMLAGHRSSHNAELRYQCNNGEIIWANLVTSLERSEAGQPKYFIAVLEDITARKLAELRLHRLNRLHTVLSKTGEAIVRVRSRAALYEAVCLVLVEEGLLRMAAVVELGAPSASVRLAAAYGEELDYLQQLTVTTDGGPLSRGTIGTALRTGVHDVCNDFATDPRMAPWRDAALARELRSAASFPLKLDGTTIGALVLFAGEAGYFEQDEIRLLVAVANDLSFALEAQQREFERRQAEEERDRLFTQSLDLLCVAGFDGRLQQVNPAWTKCLGWSATELTGQPMVELIHPADQEATLAVRTRIHRGEPVRGFENRYRCRDGSYRWLSWSVHPLSELRQVFGVARDVTQDKAAAAALQASEQAQRQLVQQLEVERSRLVAAQRVAKVGSWETDLATFAVVWSEETHRIFETDPATHQPSHESFLQMVHPDDRLRVDEAFGRSMHEPVNQVIEHRLLMPDRRIKFVEERWEISRDDQGKPVRALGTCQDVTERKLGEKRVKETEERYRALFDRSLDAVYVHDLAGRFVDANPAALQLLGYGREDVGTLCFVDILANEEEVRRAYQTMQTQLTTDVSGGVMEYQLKRRDGTLIWVELASSLVFEDGKPVAVQGIARDITARRTADQKMRESEERFRLLSKATNDAIWDWNLITNELWWNEGFETLFGYRRAAGELTIDSWYNHIHPDERDAVIAAVHRVIDTDEGSWSHKYRFRRHDGSYSHVIDRGQVIRAADGKAVRMIGGMTDVTERREAEQRIAEQAALLDIAHEAIMVKDLDDGIIYWNKGAERTYGWTVAEALGRKSRELLQPDPARFEAALTVLMETGEWRGELEKRTKADQLVTIEVGWTLVRDAAGRPKSILAINTDITERRKIEGQFLRAQRMESIGTLAGGIAHDLNNLLAPILITSQLLQDDAPNDEYREMLQTVQTCAQRGAELVKQVLSFARGVEGERIPIDVSHLLRDIRQVVRETFPKNINTVFQLGRELWAVEGDATQLHQVFMNLCVNARDAMPQGGKLIVSAENLVLDEVYAGMNPDAKPGPYVVVKVEDTGTGIPPEVQERIFEPFFTTKEIGKGTGLGLSTTLGILRSHGGFVNLSSEPGKGAKFKVYLPAITTPRAVAQAAVAQTQLPRGQGELVLVVDDEESVRSVTQKTLERFGYRVLLAANGAEAVARYAQHRAEIAVVLTDMAMPVMDGPATILALRAMNPAVKIIGSSGHASQGGVAKAVGAGVQHFVPKPYTAETMLKVLADVLAKPA